MKADVVDLGVGFEHETSFQIGAADMEAFRNLSADDNPIHFDETFARARGFAGPIVYGGLILAQVSRLLGTQLPGPGCVWQSLSLRFRAPLFVNEPARLRAKVRHFNSELGVISLAVTVSAMERRIADGEVQALFGRERGR